MGFKSFKINTSLIFFISITIYHYIMINGNWICSFDRHPSLNSINSCNILNCIIIIFYILKIE